MEKQKDHHIGKSLVDRLSETDLDFHDLPEDEKKRTFEEVMEIMTKADVADSCLYNSRMINLFWGAFKDKTEPIENLTNHFFQEIGKVLHKGKEKASEYLIEEVNQIGTQSRNKAIAFITDLINECELQDYFEVKPINKN